MMLQLRRIPVILFLSLLLIISGIISLCVFNVSHPIKLGYSGSLSGFNSELGVSGRNGAMLAVQAINAAGGIVGEEVILVAKDDLNNPDHALAVDKEFEGEGVKLIIGHMTSQMADKTVAYINANHMLMISPTIALDSLSGEDDSFFRVIPSNKTQAQSICDSMIADGISSAAVIIDKNNLLFSATLREFFVDYFQEAGGKIVHTCEFESTDQLCEDCIELISSKQIDGVFVIAASESYAYFSQRLFQLGLRTKLYGPAWAMTVDLLEHGGVSVDGAKFVNYFDNTSTSAEYIEFRNKYLSTYSNEPSFAAYLSYEAVMVMASAIKESGSTDPDILAEYIKTRQEFEGLNGPIKFDRFGDVDRTLYIYQVINGQYQIIN